jgi:hypothetical protein
LSLRREDIPSLLLGGVFRDGVVYDAGGCREDFARFGYNVALAIDDVCRSERLEQVGVVEGCSGYNWRET